MNQLSGKKGLVMVAERSIAWGIAKALHEAGAELAFTYQGEGFGKRLEPMAVLAQPACWMWMSPMMPHMIMRLTTFRRETTFWCMRWPFPKKPN